MKNIKVKQTLSTAGKNSLFLTIQAIFNHFETEGISCAVRRNFEGFDIPSKGDIDIAISTDDVHQILKILESHAEILRVKLSFGGLKVWIQNQKGDSKQLDFIWRVNRWGIVLMNNDQMRHLLTSRIKNEEIPVLTNKAIGKLLYAEKSSKQDFKRYEEILAEAGYQSLGGKRKFFWILSTALKTPFYSIGNCLRCVTFYLVRLFYPTDLKQKRMKLPRLLTMLS